MSKAEGRIGKIELSMLISKTYPAVTPPLQRGQGGFVFLYFLKLQKQNSYWKN